MTKNNIKIEIVSSSNANLSSMSHPSRQAILRVLSRHYSNVRISLIDNVADLESLIERSPDIVFLGMKYLPDGDKRIWLSHELDDNGITHTGSSFMAHQLELNKPLAKQKVQQSGLSTAEYFVATEGNVTPENVAELSYPMFVKPTALGGGAGIDSNSVVYNFEELTAKVRSIHIEHDSDSLIEEYLSGREFSVAILKDQWNEKYNIMPLELIAPADSDGKRMLSKAVKSADAETALVVPNGQFRTDLNLLAMEAFLALGGRDYGRIDIRLDAKGVPHFLEANLIPSLLEDYGSFPKSCKLNLGMGYDSMVRSILSLALIRRAEEFDIAGSVYPVTLPAF